MLFFIFPNSLRTLMVFLIAEVGLSRLLKRFRLHNPLLTGKIKWTKRTSEAKLIVPYSTVIFYPNQFQPEQGHMRDGLKKLFLRRIEGGLLTELMLDVKIDEPLTLGSGGLLKVI